VSRLESLGWQPTVPVEQNVREYVVWMREQQTTDEFLKEADRVMREQGVVRKVGPLTGNGRYLRVDV
jgi:hypothetical protein